MEWSDGRHMHRWNQIMAALEMLVLDGERTAGCANCERKCSRRARYLLKCALPLGALMDTKTP